MTRDAIPLKVVGPFHLIDFHLKLKMDVKMICFEWNVQCFHQILIMSKVSAYSIILMFPSKRTSNVESVSISWGHWVKMRDISMVGDGTAESCNMYLNRQDIFCLNRQSSWQVVIYWYQKRGITLVHWYSTRVLSLFNNLHCQLDFHINGLVQERQNLIANALELYLSCTNPS